MTNPPTPWWVEGPPLSPCVCVCVFCLCLRICNGGGEGPPGPAGLQPARPPAEHHRLRLAVPSPLCQGGGKLRSSGTGTPRKLFRDGWSGWPPFPPFKPHHRKPHDPEHGLKWGCSLTLPIFAVPPQALCWNFLSQG